MTTMRVIAKAGNVEVVQDINSVVAIRVGHAQYICTYDSAYKAIKEEVKDPVLRNSLLAQWAYDVLICNRTAHPGAH